MYKRILTAVTAIVLLCLPTAWAADRLYVPVVVSAPGHKSGEIIHVRLGSYDGERVRAEMV